MTFSFPNGEHGAAGEPSNLPTVDESEPAATEWKIAKEFPECSTTKRSLDDVKTIDVEVDAKKLKTEESEEVQYYYSLIFSHIKWYTQYVYTV